MNLGVLTLQCHISKVYAIIKCTLFNYFKGGRKNDRLQCQITLGVHLEKVQIQLHFGKILLVLGGGGGAKADGIAEVVQAQTRHYGVQVQHAECLPGDLIQQYIIELGGPAA